MIKVRRNLGQKKGGSGDGAAGGGGNLGRLQTHSGGDVEMVSRKACDLD